MLQPGRAPGRATPGDQPAAPAPASKSTTTADPGGSTPASDAAQPGGLFGGGAMMLLLPLLLFGLIIMMNRSDKKRRAEIESKLKKGDRVVTRAGIMGKVVEVGDKNARVEIAPGVVVKMVKTAIEGMAEDDSGAKKGAIKKDDKADKADSKKK